MNCPWYSVDFATATGPSSYIPYDGYAAALAGTAGFTSPAVMWGNVAADWNLDGSGIALEILFAAGQWYWVLRIVGNAFADGNGPYATADSALEAFLSSDVVPSGFCVEILCDPKSLAEAAKCFACIPKGKLREVIIYLLCQWENSIPVVVVPFADVVVRAPDLGYWQVVVDTSGNLGMQHSIGPDTPPVIMDDGSGGFWRLIVDNTGLRGTQSDPGPASAPTRIDDGTSVFWKLIVDTSGNLGAIITP